MLRPSLKIFKNTHQLSSKACFLGLTLLILGSFSSRSLTSTRSRVGGFSNPTPNPRIELSQVSQKTKENGSQRGFATSTPPLKKKDTKSLTAHSVDTLLYMTCPSRKTLPDITMQNMCDTPFMQLLGKLDFQPVMPEQTASDAIHAPFSGIPSTAYFPTSQNPFLRVCRPLALSKVRFFL